MERVEEYLSLTDVMYQFPPQFIGRVAEEALQFRGQVSQGARDSLNAAINNSNIRLDGFRDASKADAETLADAVFGEMADGNERLLRSVWRTWMETREVLRAQVAEGLGRLGVPTEGIRGKGNGSIVRWEDEDWEEKLQVIRTEAGDAEELDVKLMMTCVSGMSPYDPEAAEMVESELFNRWLVELKALPIEAPEWGELEVFVRELGAMAHEKLLEREQEQIDRLEAYIGKSQRDFEDELAFLEIDLGGWVDEAKEHPPYMGRFLQVSEALHDSLLDYMKLKPAARTRSEELERRTNRDECEELILALVKEWKELVIDAKSIEKKIEEELSAIEDDGEDVVEDSKSEDASKGDEESERETVSAAAVTEELEREREKSGRLEEEREALVTERQALEVKLADLEGEVDRLRRDLYESQQTEKLWREQFVSVSKSVAGEKEVVSGEIGNVEEALERARRAFPQQLVVALNSKSDAGTPFQRPEEVYTVLAWLGTEYYRRRTREGGMDPQFDKLLKEACSGWFYKPKQTDETKDQFPDWYRTRVGDREYELDAHVGKGTSFDPQNTIRIGFDWDEEEKRVVVGYIGRHQKNRRS